MNSNKSSIQEQFSPLFIAGCAALLYVETCKVGNYAVDWPALAAVFIGALLAYSVSKLRIHFHFGSGNPSLVSGPKHHLIIAVICAAALFPLATFLEFSQALWLTAAAACSFLYMIPVSVQQSKIGSWRSIFLLKNIMLSLVWTISTVMVPAEATIEAMTTQPLLFIVIRRFLFIYCLATLYDIPDTSDDQLGNVKTVPAIFGKKSALVLAAGALLIFSIFTLADNHIPRLTTLALLLSAAFAGGIMFFKNPSRYRDSYKLVVDSAMALQALLVLLASA